MLKLIFRPISIHYGVNQKRHGKFGLGGFATNNIQITKLESYVDEYFNVARFYGDVEGHIEDRSLQLAFEELQFFAKNLKILGTYPTHHSRELYHKINGDNL